MGVLFLGLGAIGLLLPVCLLAATEYGERFTTAARLSMDKVMELSKLDNNGLIQATLSSVM